MLSKEDLDAIGQVMDLKLKPIVARLDTMQEDISLLKEGQEETRSGVNALLEWAEECGNVIKFPLPKVK